MVVIDPLGGFGIGSGGGVYGEQTVKGTASVFNVLVWIVQFFADIRVKTVVSGGFQNFSPPIIESKHSGIGGRGLKILRSQTEECTQDHPVNAASGVTLGFDGTGNVLHRGFSPGSVHELSP